LRALLGLAARHAQDGRVTSAVVPLESIKGFFSRSVGVSRCSGPLEVFSAQSDLVSAVLSAAHIVELAKLAGFSLT
jgi:hypothetical protein